MAGMLSMLFLLGQVGSFPDTTAESIPSLQYRKKRAVDRAITILYDNNRFDPYLEARWGFSCLVEGWEKTILFDTGGDGTVLLHNMRQLGIKPEKIDAIVLSHNHADHTGGVRAVLAENRDVVVYVPISFSESFKAALRSLGARVEEVSGMRKICAGVFTTGELGKGIVEQSLVLTTPEGLVVVTGCAHPGVVNIVRTAKEMTGEDNVYLVLGGFHLANEPASRIKDILKEFRRLSVKKVAPCHCSGEESRHLFEQEYGAGYIKCGVGRRTNLRGLEAD